MITPADFLLGGILPVFVAATVCALVWKFAENAASSWRTGLVVGIVVGIWALESRSVGISTAIAKSIRITEAKDFLPLVVILSMVPDAIGAINRTGNIAGWVLRALFSILLPWRLLYGSSYLPRDPLPDVSFDTGAWSAGEAILWIGGLSLALFGTWASLRLEAFGSHPRLRSVLAITVMLATAATIALTGSLTYGQLTGVVAAALTACATVSALGQFNRGPDAACGPVAISFGTLLVLALFFSNLSLLYALLLVAAMVVGAGRFSPRMKYHALLRSGLCLALLGLAVGLAGWEFAASQAESTSNPYYNM